MPGDETVFSVWLSLVLLFVFSSYFSLLFMTLFHKKKVSWHSDVVTRFLFWKKNIHSGGRGDEWSITLRACFQPITSSRVNSYPNKF